MTFKIKNKTGTPLKVAGRTLMTEMFLENSEIDETVRNLEKMGVIRITKVKGGKNSSKF